MLGAPADVLQLLRLSAAQFGAPVQLAERRRDDTKRRTTRGYEPNIKRLRRVRA